MHFLTTNPLWIQRRAERSIPQQILESGAKSLEHENVSTKLEPGKPEIRGKRLPADSFEGKNRPAGMVSTSYTQSRSGKGAQGDPGAIQGHLYMQALYAGTWSREKVYILTALHPTPSHPHLWL